MRDLRIVVLVIVLYFGSAYFAAAALIPAFALQIALIAWILGLSAYQYLSITQGDEPSLLFGLLLLLPFLCVFVGVIWWLMRLLGFELLNFR